MIPKIIHYCWYGTNQIPAEHEAFINGWKNLMPDYKFQLWNEENSPMHLPYIQNAYKNRKWANISNFVRLYAVYNNGGIYLDTDVEVIKLFDDLLTLDCFFGFETEKPLLNSAPIINNATFGAKLKHPLIKDMMTRLLERFDGLEDAHLSSPNLMSEILRTMGFGEYGDHKYYGVNVFPKEYFYPYYVGEDRSEIKITDKTYSIHHWAKSWGQIEDTSLVRQLGNLTRETAKTLLPRKAIVRLKNVKNVVKPPEEIVQNILQSSCVLYGPFVGLRYPKGGKAFGSAFSPKIIGSYEECLHYPILSLIENKYEEIHDIGCAEGYYIGGMSMLFPDSKIIGYDISSEAVELANRLIIENNFSATTAVVRDVKQDFWQEFPSPKRTLIICDIEGGEKELFTQEAVNRLQRADLIIELHDFLDGSIKPKIKALFEKTHDVEIIREENKNISKYAILNNLTVKQCTELLDERRPCKMEWLVARSRLSEN